MSKKKNENLGKKYYVQGMHCSACEVLIKQDILNIEGVEDTKVSLSKSRVVIHAKDSKSVPSASQLNEIFEDLGYSFLEERPTERKLSKEELLKVLGIAGLFIVLFYWLENSGILMKYSLSAQSSPWSYFIFGLAAGLSSCAALVGGLLLSLSKNWNQAYGNNKKKSITPFLYFNFSRVLTFALLGGLLGYIGSFLSFSVTLTAVLTLIISFLMLVLGFQMAGIKWFNKFKFNLLGDNKYLNKNSDVQGKYVPLIVGALTFFIPCGFTLIAQTNVLTSGGFIRGMVLLGSFAVGTLPILLLISFSSVKFYSNPRFSRKFSLFSGMIIIFFALYTINSQLNVLGYKSLSDLSISSSSEEVAAEQVVGGYQVMQMEAVGFEYYPKEFVIKSGVLTKWDIYNSGSVGCAQAVYGRGLYPDVIYLRDEMTSVEFVAPAPGTYKISCSMGMVSPVTVRVTK